MTAAARPSSAHAPASADGTPVERQMAMFERLSEICMQVVEATGERVLAEAAAAKAARVVDIEPEAASLAADAPASAAAPIAARPASPLSGAPILAFTRATRAARLSLSLWRRACQEAEAKGAAAAREADEARREAAASRQARAERVVERVAHDHFEALLPGEDRDAEAITRLRDACTEARERLADEDLYGDLSAAPLSEIVERICRDVGLSPNWARLAEEHWAQAELSAGEAVPPLARFTGAADLSWPVAPPRLRSARWRRRRDPVDEAAAEPQTLRVLFVGPDGRESTAPPGGSPRGRDPDRLSVDFP